MKKPMRIQPLSYIAFSLILSSLAPGAGAEADTIFTLIHRNKHKELEALLNKKPQLVHARYTESVNLNAKIDYSPLHWAAAWDELAACKILLAHGANINAIESKKAMSPLHIAAWTDRPRIARLFLDHAADLHAEMKGGQTALHLAVYRSEKAIVKLLLDRGAKTDIFSSSGLGRIDDVIRLLHQDPSLAKATHGSGATPLHYAAANGHKLVMLALLKHKPDVDAVALNRFTPLLCAVLRKRADAVKVLLKAGANVNARGSYSGGSALHWAADRGYYKVAKLVAENGGNPNILNSHGFAPLHIAATRRHDEKMVRILLQFGADPQFRTKEGKKLLDGTMKIKPRIVELIEGHIAAQKHAIKKGLETGSSAQPTGSQ